MHCLPLRNNILVRPRPTPTQTASGLALPTARPQDVLEADVIAVGPGLSFNNTPTPSLLAGDVVWLPSQAGHRFLFNNEEHILVNAKHILAKRSSSQA